MRLLVVAERLGTAGGMERYLDVVLPALAASGVTVHVVAKRVDAPPPPGITVETIAWSDEHDAPSAQARVAMQRAIDAFAPDVAAAHNVMDAGVVRALRAVRRLAYHVHDHRPFCPNGDRLYPRSAEICAQPVGRPCAVHSLTDGCAYGPRRRTLTLIRGREQLRDAIGAADAVVVASAYMAGVATQNGIAPGKLHTIAPPLPDDAYADYDDPGAARSVVFAGRVVPQKGLDLLVRAVASTPSVRTSAVVVLGDGPALPQVRADAAGLGVRLHARGVAGPGAVRDAMDASAVVALPSVWAEPFGYVGIEAFARARPVVAYDVGGVGDWLRDGRNGVLVRRGDESGLGNAIAALVNDDALRTTFGRNARQDAERYRLGPAVERLLSAYRA